MSQSVSQSVSPSVCQSVCQSQKRVRNHYSDTPTIEMKGNRMQTGTSELNGSDTALTQSCTSGGLCGCWLVCLSVSLFVFCCFFVGFFRDCFCFILISSSFALIGCFLVCLFVCLSLFICFVVCVLVGRLVGCCVSLLCCFCLFHCLTVFLLDRILWWFVSLFVVCLSVRSMCFHL